MHKCFKNFCIVMLILFKNSSSFRSNSYMYIFHISLIKGSVRKAWVYFQKNFPSNSFPLCPWNSPGKNTGVGSHSLLQGIFPTWDRMCVSCIAGRFFHCTQSEPPRNLFIYGCTGSQSRGAGFLQLWPARGYSLFRCTSFSLWWLLLLRERGLQEHLLRGYSPLGSRVWTQQLWCRGLVALQHVGSSRTRDRTLVTCIGRQILSHWTTKEVPFTELLEGLK